MTDKEKIEAVMRAKGMPNGEFSEKIGITAASLSHILSGRSNPTLPVLRGVVKAFPDINPMWLYGDDDNMYVVVSTDAFPKESGDDCEPESDVYGLLDPVSGANVFGMSSEEAAAAAAPSSQPSSRGAAGTKGKASQPAQSADMAELLTISKAILGEIQRPQRKVTEVRIFFDDGTYETFTTR